MEMTDYSKHTVEDFEQKDIDFVEKMLQQAPSLFHNIPDTYMKMHVQCLEEIEHCKTMPHLEKNIPERQRASDRLLRHHHLLKLLHPELFTTTENGTDC